MSFELGEDVSFDLYTIWHERYSIRFPAREMYILRHPNGSDADVVRAEMILEGYCPHCMHEPRAPSKNWDLQFDTERHYDFHYSNCKYYNPGTLYEKLAEIGITDD